MNSGGATRKNMIGVQKYPNTHERALGYSVYLYSENIAARKTIPPIRFLGVSVDRITEKIAQLRDRICSLVIGFSVQDHLFSS